LVNAAAYGYIDLALYILSSEVKQSKQYICIATIERWNPWPHVANRHISGHLLSLWHHSHYDVIRAARAYGARNPQPISWHSLLRLG